MLDPINPLAESMDLTRYIANLAWHDSTPDSTHCITGPDQISTLDCEPVNIIS
ncbi:8373_t:CDS:2 [Acaulospora morrowiae]|uniref:8373_t:CDS:1 n=1 Tax=Acaulospora morrowiae TaxID=94023 RepID=A0A9N9GYH3_9GLOM|nr:8373_t:CDS:2 [Acaulospora morrowiae]